jgi:hypothetical protein
MGLYDQPELVQRPHTYQLKLETRLTPSRPRRPGPCPSPSTHYQLPRIATLSPASTDPPRVKSDCPTVASADRSHGVPGCGRYRRRTSYETGSNLSASSCLTRTNRGRKTHSSRSLTISCGTCPSLVYDIINCGGPMGKSGYLSYCPTRPPYHVSRRKIQARFVAETMKDSEGNTIYQRCPLFPLPADLDPDLQV